METPRKIVIAGAGLVGSLLAIAMKKEDTMLSFLKNALIFD